METNLRIIKWFVSGETGASSEMIVAHLMNMDSRSRFNDYPVDGGDFGRCYKLLKAVPEFASRIGEMASVCPQWAALVAHWDELTRLYESDDKTIYKRMTAILDAVPDENKVSLGNGVSIHFPAA